MAHPVPFVSFIIFFVNKTPAKRRRHEGESQTADDRQRTTPPDHDGYEIMPVAGVLGRALEYTGSG